jgi:hypothetical protein
METPTREVAPMLAAQHFQTPGVVVRRAFYEQFGGFAQELVHCADWEMWVRAVHFGSGVVHPQPLANYRIFAANDSGRLARKGDNVRDILRLEEVFKSSEGFSSLSLRQDAARRALNQYYRYVAEGDVEAARNNRSLYEELVPLPQRLARSGVAAIRRMARCLVGEALR